MASWMKATGKLVIARAGHDPALLFRRETGKVELLRSPGLALGVDGGAVFERVTKDQEVELLSGRLRACSTRTASARRWIPQEEEFGMERMSEAFRMAAPLGAEAVLPGCRKNSASSPAKARRWTTSRSSPSKER